MKRASTVFMVLYILAMVIAFLLSFAIGWWAVPIAVGLIISSYCAAFPE